MHIKYFVYANVRTKYDVIARHAITLLVTIILNLSNTYCLNFFFVPAKRNSQFFFLNFYSYFKFVTLFSQIHFEIRRIRIFLSTGWYEKFGGRSFAKI